MFKNLKINFNLRPFGGATREAKINLGGIQGATDGGHQFLQPRRHVLRGRLAVQMPLELPHLPRDRACSAMSVISWVHVHNLQGFDN